ncbi:MAG: riboflavin synthase [Myxococcota bacterium]
MFTGIVEHVGRIDRIERQPDLTRFVIDLGPIAEGVRLGDSIAVAGACLTVTRIEGTRHTFEAIPETLARTRLGGLEVGDGVNLERAMAAGARFDGHVVQGHVDGLARVAEIVERGNEVELHLELRDPALASALVDKGSVTLDGVSLTVVRAVESRFHVALIPHTLAHTTLSRLRPGDVVNVEVDVFAKYLKRYLDDVLPGLVATALTKRDGAGTA